MEIDMPKKVKTLRQHAHRHHWHYVYKRRRKFKSISQKEILIGQIISVSGSLLAGVLLEFNKEQLMLFAGAFLLLPGLIDLAASITGAMCAKINHRLEEQNRPLLISAQSIGFAISMSIIAGAVVGLVGGLIGEIFFDSTFWQLFALSLTTMIVVGVITYPLMALLTFLVRRRGADPDNIVGPVESGFTDMLTVLVVAALVRLMI